jgi:hypothetical protein
MFDRVGKHSLFGFQRELDFQRELICKGYTGSTEMAEDSESFQQSLEGRLATRFVDSLGIGFVDSLATGYFENWVTGSVGSWVTGSVDSWVTGEGDSHRPLLFGIQVTLSSNPELGFVVALPSPPQC